MEKNGGIIKLMASRDTCTAVPEITVEEELLLLKTKEERKRFRNCFIDQLKDKESKLSKHLNLGGQITEHEKFCSYLYI